MGLGKSRVAIVGESPYPHEQEAIKFAIDKLPNVDPYHLWALIDLLEPSSGRLHEIDLLIVGYSAIYLVEVKSGPGTYVGDSVDWWRTPPGELRSRWMDPPRKLANLKAKVVKSLLGYKLKNRNDAPWIEPLIFLSHENVTLKLEPDGIKGVVTRANFRQAITSHVFHGAPKDWRTPRINRTQMRAVVKALESIGFRKRKGKAHVGPYELGQVLAEGQGYKDREAVHRDQARLRAIHQIDRFPRFWSHLAKRYSARVEEVAA